MGKRATTIKLIIDTVAKTTGVDELTKKIQKINTVLSKPPKGFKGIDESFKKATRYASEFKKVINNPQAQQAIERLKVAQQKYGKEVERVKVMTQPTGATLNNLNKLQEEYKEAAQEVAKYGDAAGESGAAKQVGDFSTKLSGAGIDISKFSGILTEAVASSAALGVALPVLGAVIAGVAMAAKAAKWIFEKWSKQLKDFSQGIKQLWGGLKNSVGAFRLMAQGVLTVARSMTFFVSAPITLFLKEATEAALKMEDALVRVAKVTGDLFEEAGSIGKYRDELARLGVVSASSMEQLAKFTEQLGQMGLRDKNGMLQMVAIMDVVAAATDIAADSIATDLGSIANAFGHSLSFSGEALEDTIFFIDRTAEVINALENTAGSTASEIVEMLKDIGSTFSGLTGAVDDSGMSVEMNMGQIAGWVTIGREMGMTASEVGTAMRRLPAHLLNNADAIDELNIKGETFASTTQFLTRLHQDFYGTVDDLVTVLAKDTDALNTVGASTELLGVRSGRMLQNLVKAKKAFQGGQMELSRYNDIMESANEAWLHGGSLMSEYNKYLDSTTVNIQMLKNGFENLSIVVGDDIIPLMNKLIDVASAGALAFSQLYKTIGPGIKKTIGQFISFAALYGPVSWFLSQTIFGVTMIANGLMRLGSFIMPLVGLFGKLVVGLLTLNPILMLVGGVLFKLFENYTIGIQGIAGKVDDMLSKLSKNVGDWGKTIMDTFAGGIVAGSKAVIGAISAVAQTIASFLEAHSPPEQGPLSGIDMWGAVLMNTFLKGFGQADFGILSDVAGRVESMLGSLHFTPSGEDDEDERKKVLKGIIKFKEIFSKLLKDNKRGVKITDSYLDSLVEGFGTSKDEIKKLIKAHLDLERVQLRLAAIEEERTATNDMYEDQVQTIRLSGDTAEDMVESIASAAYERDQSLSALSEEEKLLKKREEMFQAQLELQGALLDALQEQSDLWKELLTMQAATSGGSGDSDLGESSGFNLDTTSITGISDKLKEAQLRFVDLNVAATKFKIVLFTLIGVAKIFWAALMNPDADLGAMWEDFEKNIMAASGAAEAAVSWMDDIADAYGDSLIDPEMFEIDSQAIGKKIADSLSSVMNMQDGMIAFNDWVDTSFPDLDEDIRAGLEEAVRAGFTDFHEIPMMGTMGEDFSYETFTPLSDAEMLFDDLIPKFKFWADEMSPIGADLKKGVGDILSAFGAGYNGEDMPGINNIGVPIEAGFDMSGDSSSNPLASVGYNIGQFADLLVNRVPDILEQLGILAEKFADFLLGDSVSGEDTMLGKLTVLLDGLLAFIDGINTIIEVAGTLFEFSIVGQIISIFSNLKDLGDVDSAIGAWLVTMAAKFLPVTEFLKNPLGVGFGAGGDLGLGAEGGEGGGKVMKSITLPEVDTGPFDKFITWLFGTFYPKMDEFLLIKLPTLFAGFGVALENLNLFAKGKSAIKNFARGIFDTLQKLIDVYNNMLDVSNLDETMGLPYIHVNFPDVDSWQGGGRPHAGAFGLIGEAGRELFSAPVAGKITSHSLTEKMMRDVSAGVGAGSGSWNITINNPVVRDDSDIDTLVDTIMYRIAEEVV